MDGADDDDVPASAWCVVLVCIRECVMGEGFGLTLRCADMTRECLEVWGGARLGPRGS